MEEELSAPEIKNVDDSKTKAVPGVIAVIPLKDQVVVVADSTWTAMRGAKLLKLETTGGDESINDENIFSQFKNDKVHEGVPVAYRGDIKSAKNKAYNIVELEYLSPLQAHAAMEPLCATASVSSDWCEVWAPTQSPDFVKMMAEEVTEMPPEKIKVHTTYLGGGFGRKIEYDFILAPLVSSKFLGKPVKVTWTREEDTRRDYFRPPFMINMQFILDSKGLPDGLKVKMIGPAVSRRWQMPPPWLEENGYDWVVTIGMFDGYKLPNRKPDLSKAYSIPNLKVDFVPSDILVPTGAWRSIGTSHNLFALESGLDEVAYLGGNDPFELRSKLLNHNPRAKAVLEKTNAGEYDVAVCPPAVHLSGVRDVLAGSHIAVGAQDVHWENFGAFTGEISVPMLETYCDYVIIGHSERRQLFGETNETVNKKLLAVLDSSLLPIVAIGETEEQRRNNETEEVLAHQIVEGFTGVTLGERITVAYEPVWAIGTGLTPTPEEAQSACAFIRETLAQIDSESASVMRILYGGSVKPSNAGDLLKNSDIDGALVGGASLDAGQFVDIINAIP